MFYSWAACVSSSHFDKNAFDYSNCLLIVLFFSFLFRPLTDMYVQHFPFIFHVIIGHMCKKVM